MNVLRTITVTLEMSIQQLCILRYATATESGVLVLWSVEWSGIFRRIVLTNM
jgi:hypothetical protein